ncbi:BamA/TamA family outer membrane protein [Fusobacterium necrophorum]|uniref:ShlB/FhaC/HecB family hemolysin secretion/activation protein n=1 Tax=Fusobacterium necrophorum TaxID=859 RepID=UPI00254C1811|nr:ShlB/FhaC/HecB family hemolysin secretion/activation protein [Fusobacterium necrophorum]MDK4501267.1 BamA/TamA family outer membrane protein [Fusobacterium necrophorum]
MFQLKKALKILLFLSIFNSSSIFAEEVGILSTELDSGILTDRNNKIFQQEKLQRTLKYEKEKRKQGIENLEERKEEDIKVSDVSFLLKKMEIPKSDILTEQEMERIWESYIEKEITITELYTIVQKINELYQEKGYLVCRAVLPAQKIQNGIVNILLIEGKTGDITIQGNHSTREKYIEERIPLEKGKISNFKELDRSLTRFNLTNDSPIQVNMTSGKVLGTTDYFLQIYEPKRQQFFTFADNLGQKNTGELRWGISYINNSVTGNRDQLSLTSLLTEGTASLSSIYTFPVSKKGTKVSLQHSLGKLKHIQGALKHKITGNSYSYGIGIVHPVLVDEKNKIELSLDWGRQRTVTDLLKLNWVNNRLSKYTAGIGISHYEEDSIFYTKQNITKGKFIPISGDEKKYTKYDMFLMYQKNLKYHALATLRMTGQYSLSKKLPSVEQIYAGGAYNVRGYPESFMGAEHGIFFNIELSKLVENKGEFFVFLDGASLHGESAWQENRIFSSGFGYRLRFLEKNNIAVSMAFPWKKTINSISVDSNRIYITINHEF